MQGSWLTSQPLRSRPQRYGLPLFDLPDAAVELVLGFVDGLEDKRALRLVCKRSRASVDGRVEAVENEDNVESEQLQLAALVQAPWKLQRLDLNGARRPWRQRAGQHSECYISVSTAWVLRARHPWRQRTSPPLLSYVSVQTACATRGWQPWRQRTSPPSRS